MNEGSLYVHSTGGVGIVEFSHPQGNSLPGALLDRMARAFGEMNDDPSVKVVILRSEGGRAFCAGASLSELLSIETRGEADAFFRGFGSVIESMINCRKPVIGRIQGKAVGGAVGLIAACDYVMATRQAAARLSEWSIGIGPFVIEPVISYKAGVAATMQMSMSPTRWFDAYWMKDRGLYARVFDTIDELDHEVDHLAAAWTHYSEEAASRIKRMNWEGLKDYGKLMRERAAISGELVLTPGAKSALSKFKKRRS